MWDWNRNLDQRVDCDISVAFIEQKSKDDTRKYKTKKHQKGLQET